MKYEYKSTLAKWNHMYSTPGDRNCGDYDWTDHDARYPDPVEPDGDDWELIASSVWKGTRFWDWRREIETEPACTCMMGDAANCLVEHSDE
jgi:hypothetical protein